MPWLRKALYAVAVFTGSAMITTFFLDTFWCGSEVSVNWSLEEDACNTFTSKAVFRIDWGMNIVSDMLSMLSKYSLYSQPESDQAAVFGLPFPLLHSLQLQRRQIWGLIVTFCLGAVTIAMSVIRFVTIEVIYAWTNVCMSSYSGRSRAAKRSPALTHLQLCFQWLSWPLLLS